MNKMIFTIMLSISCHAFSQVACDAAPVDLLMIGDSQTGATWASGYFGNYLQKCLKDKSVKIGNFVVYGRGGTVPNDWINRSGMDKIETIERNNDHNHKNLGTAVPLCKKRIAPMLDSHDPKKFVAFFGDNLLANTNTEIITQFKALALKIKEHNIAKKDCYFLTPTFEMEVATKRNVPSKNLVNTKLVIAAIKAAVADTCQVIDGLDLMKNSPYHLSNDLLQRKQRTDGAGCMGASANDNIHICGEAAFDFANRVCEKLVQ